jgi:hypothetical protein
MRGSCSRRTKARVARAGALNKQWCIPPPANGEFVGRLEDVLAVYTQPYHPQRPQVCRDETSKQLLREVRPPLPGASRQPTRVAYEYERAGARALA